MVLVGAVVAGSVAGCGGCGGSSDEEKSDAGITATPTAIVFTEPYTGKTYTQVVTITSSGADALSVSGITVEDTTPGGGILSLAEPFEPFSLPPGQTREVTVQLAAACEATPAGTLHLASNARDVPVLDVPISSTRTDEAALASCVLTGASVADGCELDGSQLPTMSLGDTPLGTAASRVVALSNTGAGSVPVAITSVTVVPAVDAGTHFTVELFTLDGLGNEVARTLPFYLNPPDASDSSPATELRARVVFDALLAQGAIPAVSLEITTRHPAGTLTIPISGNVVACVAGTSDCDDDPANGCEITSATDLANCGGCGLVCGSANGAPACTDDVCALNCNPDFDSCDGDDANGCETNLTYDLANCGLCGTVCDPANGQPNCVLGQCGVAECDYGFKDCNFNAADGCEANLASDPNHCGDCTNACSTPNATPGCSAGVCTISSCNTNYLDCDSAVATGCEVNRLTDVNNCGTCGTVCSAKPNTATTSCSAGSCALTCNATYYNVDNYFGNGCEARLDSYDLANSGSSCAAAAGLGTLYDDDYPAGVHTALLEANIVPAYDADYFIVYASDTFPYGHGYSVDVRFSYNPGGALRFDVWRGNTCSMAQATAVQQFQWKTNMSWFWTGTLYAGMENCTTSSGGYYSGTTAHCDNLPSGSNAYYVVRVYHPSGQAVGSNYQLQISNGVY